MMRYAESGNASYGLQTLEMMRYAKRANASYAYYAYAGRPR